MPDESPLYAYGATFSVRVALELVSVNTTRLTLLAFARTLKFRALPAETVPLETNVAISAPVSALMTVKLVTACAATHIGADSNVPHKTALYVVEIFIFSSKKY
jgi:hypothetical protein